MLEFESVEVYFLKHLATIYESTIESNTSEIDCTIKGRAKTRNLFSNVIHNPLELIQVGEFNHNFSLAFCIGRELYNGA